jgi:glutathionylspermidine synthase
VIGSWVVGGKSAGICLREDRSPITTNMSHFVPHYVVN